MNRRSSGIRRPAIDQEATSQDAKDKSILRTFAITAILVVAAMLPLQGSAYAAARWCAQSTAVGARTADSTHIDSAVRISAVPAGSADGTCCTDAREIVKLAERKALQALSPTRPE